MNTKSLTLPLLIVNLVLTCYIAFQVTVDDAVESSPIVNRLGECSVPLLEKEAVESSQSPLCKEWIAKEENLKAYKHVFQYRIGARKYNYLVGETKLKISKYCK